MTDDKISKEAVLALFAEGAKRQRGVDARIIIDHAVMLNNDGLNLPEAEWAVEHAKVRLLQEVAEIIRAQVIE